ncbi:MAG: outer membrane beta-barrel protein [Gammaproteobacteria bacterium]|nr:outer membrane beta-barrel protein [Gammaproteobacteria bacterium]
MTPPTPISSRQLMTELQSFGLRLVDPSAGVASRRGGAGPSDHKAVTVDGHTIMVPVHTSTAWESPFVAQAPDGEGRSTVMRGAIPIASISFPRQPRFYAMQTFDGVPYSHIATLHGSDVLATTVLQTCIRYQSRTKTCQFCAIGQSLAAGRTVEDTPVVGAGAYVANSASFSVDHELLRNVILNARLFWSRDDYEGVDREDTRVGANIGGTYLINRNLGINASFSTLDTQSDGAARDLDFTVNKLAIALVAQF